MTEVHDIINQRNEIIAGTLDVVGPALSNALEELKVALKKKQDTLGPSIEATMDNRRDGVRHPWLQAALCCRWLSPS
jgi:methyl-accepting chemotaxis protein